MSGKESLRLALESLVANRMRSILTMLGIVIGVAAVIAVIAIGRGTRAAVLSEFEGVGGNILQVVAMPPTGSNPGQRYETFTDDDIRRLERSITEIERIFSLDGFRAQGRHGNNSYWGDVSGSPSYFADVFKMKLSEGRWYTEAEDQSGARVVVLSPRTREKLFGEGPAVGQIIHLGGYPFEVIGVQAPETGLLAQSFGGGQGPSYSAPFGTVNRITGNRTRSLLLIDVRAGSDLSQVSRDVMDIIKAAHPGGNFMSISTQEIMSAIGNVTGILTTVIGAIAGISLLVGGVGIMNIMLVSVTERTREIGIRKAIGARRRDILWQFLIEAVVVSAAGGALGTLLAALPAWAVGRWLGVGFLLSWDAVALSLGFSVAVGIAFGVYPANKAASLDPIEALRYE